ncbi:aspartate 4-decarboxylase [Alicyclobacillus sp. SO9]|uniref:aspartate 4-decarboxylase n=1 Tax=Alicyclobacillus sp. SO9 TaxID=2665646 RepID=UPI0018E85D85|nr:aspartate 4-decarboxylase [Alicyclobacillus sp. SO9]QQE79892.1 aspartate 4-decarboxylase [Alicyclobacillus sp. SO9]
MTTDVKSSLEDRRRAEKPYEKISPFEFKNKLISLAKEHEKQSAKAMLNAGRGNPNWIAATPREAFFALGRFAVEESRRTWNQQDLAGKPSGDGIAQRFKEFIDRHQHEEGVALLQDIVDYGIDRNGFSPDEWIHELVDGIIGDNYPMPDRMLVHSESIVHDFLLQELCGNDTSLGKFDLFAVEGATAAMCYLFDSLQENRLLAKGAKVAVMVPIFPPYVEIPKLWRYNFDVVEIRAFGTDGEGRHTWQYPESELNKLRDTSIHALFLVNPSNPPSVAMNKQSVATLKAIIKESNPSLMIISDDVYSTFVEGYRSLIAELPYNTLCVYSLSKYFGVTGWRLGVIALHKENVFDDLLKGLPEETVQMLNQRYSSITEEPASIRFIDRVVADSRQVALNHTAGLSTPQQIQMTLFAAFALLDTKNTYKRLTMDICQRRMRLLYEGLELPMPKIPNDADYYTEFDLQHWAGHHYGKDFAQHLEENYEPLDILFRLAEQSSIVLLNGGGFHGPKWSIRVSLANLEDQAYREIGGELHRVLEDYVKEWRVSRQK